jgi:negative regulator of sigma E activity
MCLKEVKVAVNQSRAIKKDITLRMAAVLEEERAPHLSEMIWPQFYMSTLMKSLVISTLKL